MADGVLGLRSGNDENRGPARSGTRDRGRHAADRIRVLTPLGSREAMGDRLDDILGAMRSWDALDE